MRNKIWVIALITMAGGALATGQNVTTLSVIPPELTFRSPDEGMRVLIVGTTADGEKVDLSESAQFDPAEAIVKRSPDGLLYATRQGETKVTVTAGGAKAQFTAHVADLSKPPQVSFLPMWNQSLIRLVVPRAFATARPKEKNGFKLSLRGYDPEFDYEALLYDMSGRRFNRAEPARSLMLAKPTQQVPHGGGLRIELGSRYYKTILSWISAGVPYGDPKVDRVEKLEVLPKEVFMHGPSKTQQVLALAHYSDGSVAM